MSERKGLLASLFGGRKSGICYDMQIFEDDSQEEMGENRNS